MGFGLERQDGGLYPFHDGSPGGLTGFGGRGWAGVQPADVV